MGKQVNTVRFQCRQDQTLSGFRWRPGARLEQPHPLFGDIGENTSACYGVRGTVQAGPPSCSSPMNLPPLSCRGRIGSAHLFAPRTFR